jgi:hypothetical protein
MHQSIKCCVTPDREVQRIAYSLPLPRATYMSPVGKQASDIVSTVTPEIIRVQNLSQ